MQRILSYRSSDRYRGLNCLSTGNGMGIQNMNEEVGMKLWVVLTIVLYLLCVSVVVVPLLLLASDGSSEIHDAFFIFYYIFVPVLVVAQGVLLLVPVGIVRERPVRRRGIVVSAVVAAIPMAALTFGFFYSFALMIWGENQVDSFLDHPLPLLALLIFWLVWGAVFIRSYADLASRSFTSHLTRWLLRGSILELLVAIPSHIISRQRNECCAPIGTLLGIATGLAIALMSFGPGVFLLFAQRIRNKKAKQ